MVSLQSLKIYGPAKRELLLRVIFFWGLSWALFCFWFFKERFVACICWFNSMDSCHSGFCRMQTFTIGVGQLSKHEKDTVLTFKGLKAHVHIYYLGLSWL